MEVFNLEAMVKRGKYLFGGLVLRIRYSLFVIRYSLFVIRY